ncbi:hypothetical protein ACVWY2_006640 [Bradyrhizobium sp. JR6.1]
MTNAKGTFSASQPLGDREGLLAPDETDVEQREIRRALGDQFERAGDVRSGAHRPGAEAQDGVLEIERDDRIVLDHENVTGHAGIASGFHGAVSIASMMDERTGSVRPDGPRPAPESTPVVPEMKLITSQAGASVH